MPLDKSQEAVTLRRYAFLTGFSMRNDAEEIEVHALKKKLLDMGIDPGWPIISRDLCTLARSKL